MQLNYGDDLDLLMRNTLNLHCVVRLCVADVLNVPGQPLEHVGCLFRCAFSNRTVFDADLMLFRIVLDV